jgi:SAM-dependent methyltransferase
MTSKPAWTAESHLGPSPFLKRVYAASTAEESRAIYDEWAAQYNTDLEAEQYIFPRLAAQALSDATGLSDLGTLSIIDAGCGTGLVGLELSKLGAKHVVGLDISPGMLEIARKIGVYNAGLEEADLSKPLVKDDESVDAVVCVGTLTRGHVGPKPILEEFARVVKNGGVVVATVLDDIWESGGFKAEVGRLSDLGKIQVLKADVVGVTARSNTGGRLLVYKKP